MRITPAPIRDAFVLDVVSHADERGLFARTMCQEEFAAAGLPTRFVQMNTSFNVRRGTLRGMHYQSDPYPEGKLVRCTRGAIFDVMVDLRPLSPSFRKWFGAELTAHNRASLFIPAGCAHGFQTLTDDSEVFYCMTETYRPDLARGVRWNDPAFGIAWPIANPTMSERDATYPDFGA